MKRIVIAALGIMFLTNCGNKTEYRFSEEINLKGMNPISAAVSDNGFWVSDSKNNRVIEIDDKGEILQNYGGFERPMHIASFENKIYIPEYLNDSVKVIENGKVYPLRMEIKPDAPGGIDVNGSTIALADFYNHRIIVKTKNKTYAFGKKGHKPGELFYPTDVKIVNDKIVVADAYNNRIQIFTVSGKFIRAIGEKDKIKVATGIDADDDKIIITDSGNNRVIIYDWSGKKITVLTEKLKYPIDAVINGDKLFICNFHIGSIAVYEK